VSKHAPLLMPIVCSRAAFLPAALLNVQLCIFDVLEKVCARLRLLAVLMVLLLQNPPVLLLSGATE
jgi:hypothetical protein